MNESPKLQTPDEISVAFAAIRAKGHAEDAKRSAERVREAINTFQAAWDGHATPYVARSAAVTVRTRTTRAANHAARNVRAAEYQAERAHRVAKTPLARKFAIEAQESVGVASNHADNALRMACDVCEEAGRDILRACEFYKQS